MSKGFPGVPGNLQGLVKQAQKMQEQLQKLQAEAENLTGEGSAGGGMVRAVCNGKHELKTLAIDPQVINPADAEMLQDLIVAAVNEGMRKVDETVKEKMGAVTGGMNVPGLF